jgi:hypothetical protein
MITPAQWLVRKALREAARRHGISPDLLDALGKVESNWLLDATNKTGGDLARGGAYGPTQITERTARQNGYTEPMLLLCEDAEVAAELTCVIMASRPGGTPQNAEDAGAWWNAGKTSVTKLVPDHVTRTTYIPRLRAALDSVIAGNDFDPVC